MARGRGASSARSPPTSSAARGCACRARQAARSLAVVGHIDEIGVVVTHLGDDGIAAIRPVGGFNPAVMVGQRVDVLTRNGPLPGVVVARVQKQRRGRAEERKALEYDDLFLDVGAKDGDELQEPRASRGRGALARRAARAGGATASPRGRSTTGSAATSRSRRRDGWRSRAEAPATSSQSPPCRRRSATSRARAPPPSPPSRRLRSRSTSRTRTTFAVATRRTRARSCSAEGRRCRVGRRSIRAIFELLHETAEAEKIPFAIEVSRGTTSTDADAVYLSRARHRHGPRLGTASLHALAGRDGRPRGHRAGGPAHRRVRAQARAWTRPRWLSWERESLRHRLGSSDAVRQAQRRPRRVPRDRARRDRDPRGPRARSASRGARSTT